ncbi:MAG: NADH-quinone oxidoreductase subunit J [Pedosphaera sp.]|nr:NADH-quinone oxidoreductase subunit J [Pedosphaera sp.]
MVTTFVILTIVTLVSAIAAMSLRNLVHCALCLVLTFAGLAAFYLQLNAQFVGFAQILVYVGAVAILIVFAMLLTRNVDSTRQAILSPSWGVGIVGALLVFGAIVLSILCSTMVHRPALSETQVTVLAIGEQLMTNYVLPLEVIALLLTAAMIGAVIIALHEPTSESSAVQNPRLEPSVPSVPNPAQVPRTDHP